MQFINKNHIEPNDWNIWFTVPPNRRSYDYKRDYSALTNLRFAKQFLIDEQNCLCAYCQQEININNSSIEHVTPKEHNLKLSTSYFNLVAVCSKDQIKDPVTGKYHCDRNRGSQLIPTIIFHSNCESFETNTNYYFSASSNGQIFAKQGLQEDIKKQVDAFITILNLNHKILQEKRSKDFVRGLTEAYLLLPRESHQKRIFWKIQYNRILNNRSHPFREYLLIFIGAKIGLT